MDAGTVPLFTQSMWIGLSIAAPVGPIGLLSEARVPLALAGGAFLLWLAWRTWRTAPAAQAATVGGGPRMLACFAATFGLTLSNPATIFSFIAVFGALASRGVPASPWPMVAGVLLGSALWWLLLSALVGWLRTRFDVRAQRLVNRLSALLLAGFAVWQWTLLLADQARSGPGARAAGAVMADCAPSSQRAQP